MIHTLLRTIQRPAARTREALLGSSLLLALIVGCDFPGRPKSSDRYVPPREERSFEALFGRNCVGCHGEEGTLGPAPPLNDPLFLSLIPDAELRRVIAVGRPGTLMPAFAENSGGELTDAQVEILASGLKPRWGKEKPVVPPEGAPAYLADRAARSDPTDGARVFTRACAPCHGDDGRGMDDGNGEGAGSIRRPEFLALLSDQALRRLVITGRPDLGMPDYAGKDGRHADFKPLTDRDVADLAALLARWRQGDKP